MKVLFLMLAFPDMEKSFNMYTTLAEEFNRNGHEVYVIAPATSGKKTQIKEEKGIKVLRVATLPLQNTPNYIKGISNLLLPFLYKSALQKFLPTISLDLVILPTPPITLVDIAMQLKHKHNAQVYLILRDIFPQNAVDLEFMSKKSPLYKYFRAKEKKLYNTAEHIGCMSTGNINYIIQHNPCLEVSKLHELKNYQKLYPLENGVDNSLKEKYNLTGKFVVVFGGNMGKPQQLENVLELAKGVQGYPEIVFLLIGSGREMNALKRKIKTLALTNIQIQDPLPKQEYQKLISVCDIGLISLHKNFTIPNIPSKTLDYFNVGLPVLASIDKATDYNRILEESMTGLWSYAGDHEGFRENLLKLYRDKSLRAKMSRNARDYFQKYLTPDIAYNTIIGKVTKETPITCN